MAVPINFKLPQELDIHEGLRLMRWPELLSFLNASRLIGARILGHKREIILHMMQFIKALLGQIVGTFNQDLLQEKSWHLARLHLKF